MSITLPADMFVRNEALPWFAYNFVKSTKLMQGFMGGPGSPIVLSGLDFLGAGYYTDQPVLKPITSLIAVRDVANGGNPATPASLTSRNDNGVLVRFRALVNIGEDAGRIAWGLNTQRLVNHFVEETAKEWLALMQTYAIGIAKAAIEHMTTSAHTKSVWSATVRTNLSNSLILQGMQLLTDKQQDYFGVGKGVLVTQSGPAYDLANIQLTQGVAGIADNMVRQGIPQTHGIPFVVAQDSSLTATDGGYDKYYTLGIGPNAMNIKLEAPRFYMSEQRLDTEVVTNLFRADMDAYFQVPGFNYDYTSGGENPSFATLTTTTNWDVTYSDAREVPLFELEHNYSGN